MVRQHLAETYLVKMLQSQLFHTLNIYSLPLPPRYSSVSVHEAIPYKWALT